MNPLLIPVAIKAVVAGVLVATLLGGAAWVRHSLIEQGRQEAQTQCQADKDKEKEEAQKEADRLQHEADQARKDMTNAIHILNSNHARIVAGLRKRATRAEAAADAGPPAGQCDGTGLYREDGEFLVGEAARANLLRLELLRCYDQYDRARGTVK